MNALLLMTISLLIQSTPSNSLAYSFKVKSRRPFIGHSVHSFFMLMSNNSHGAQDSDSIRLGFTGDVMIGRAVDAILPYHVDGRLRESFVKHAQTYVDLAIKRNGPLPHDELVARGFRYIWGDLLDDLKGVDCLVMNLETSLTTSDDWAPFKGIHYRSHPLNVEALKSTEVQLVTLANNHVLDFGSKGLIETFNTLEKANILYAGAGRNLNEAMTPIIINNPHGIKTNVIVTALGFPSAGVPESWKAQIDQCGLYVAHEPDGKLAQAIMNQIKAKNERYGNRRQIKVVSLHWGPNWGFDIPTSWRSFAHNLIDFGADIVVGHSSHHVKGVEVYKNKMIAYGMGDFLNDYEGIVGQGYEDFRDDLCLLYIPKVDCNSGELIDLELIPGKIKNLKVQRATETSDIEWLVQTIREQGVTLGTSCDKIMDQSGRISLKILWK
jgi:poly-gamma-glutamate capsule biosynthesis protein CapA/YwtB (metallophosphatase superfamily)